MEVNSEAEASFQVLAASSGMISPGFMLSQKMVSSRYDDFLRVVLFVLIWMVVFMEYHWSQSAGVVVFPGLMILLIYTRDTDRRPNPIVDDR